MEYDEVMLTVRITAAERTLLRRLAAGCRGDVSEVVTDGLLDVLPMLYDTAEDDLRRAALAPPAPFALTVWLPSALDDLLPLASARITQVTGVRPRSSCAMLGTAIRLWLDQDPQRLAASLHVIRAGRPRVRAAA